MKTQLMNAMEWASIQFCQAQLGDPRRTRRLIKVACALAKTSHGTLPGTFSRWADLKAAYRLFSQENVTYEKIINPHWSHTRKACRQPGEYLLIEDTTQLDFTSHLAAEDLGRIGDDGGRGLFVHSTLALRVERWNDRQEPDVTVLGLFGQKCWARPESIRCRQEKKRDRLLRPRESQRWAEVFHDIACPDSQSKWTYVADRESDIYEVFGRCRAKRIDFIIRANQPRALAKEDRSVFQAVSEVPVLGRFTIDLRSRPGQAARKAKMELRAKTVTLRAPWRPAGAQQPFEVTVVEACEVEAPAGVKPIRWVLLTSWPCADLRGAMRVVKAYARRWLIEEYHKALKSGVGVEQSQLSTAGRIQALFGILAVVAVRLLNTKLLARTHPSEPVAPEEIGPEALTILEAEWGKPDGGWTYSSVLIAVARLGGFMARKHDGNPGWITIWRGWQKLMLMVQGFSLSNGETCG